VVATTDPATLPRLTTWYLLTNLPRPAGRRAQQAQLAEIVGAYGRRNWVEQGYKQVKDELGWADFQVRADRAIRRHWTLVCLAFSFCWHAGHAQAAQAGGPAAPVAAPPDQAGARGSAIRTAAWPRHPTTSWSTASRRSWPRSAQTWWSPLARTGSLVTPTTSPSAGPRPRRSCAWPATAAQGCADSPTGDSPVDDRPLEPSAGGRRLQPWDPGTVYDLRGVPDDRIDIAIDTSVVAAPVRAAMREHRTQWADMNPAGVPEAQLEKNVSRETEVIAWPTTRPRRVLSDVFDDL
jgi:hypothetical protein